MERRELMGEELGRWWERTQGLTEVCVGVKVKAATWLWLTGEVKKSYGQEGSEGHYVP